MVKALYQIMFCEQKQCVVFNQKFKINPNWTGFPIWSWHCVFTQNQKMKLYRNSGLLLQLYWNQEVHCFVYLFNLLVKETEKICLVKVAGCKPATTKIKHEWIHSVKRLWMEKWNFRSLSKAFFTHLPDVIPSRGCEFHMLFICLC